MTVDGRLTLVTPALLRELRRNPEKKVRPAGTDSHERSRDQLELRRLLLKTVGCADRLSRDQRRVLVLRVGGGPQRPLTRGEVADRLDLSRRQVVRVERSVRQDLRALADDRACAPAVGGSAGPSAAVAGGTFAQTPGGGTADRGTANGAPTGEVDGEVAGASASGSSRSDRSTEAAAERRERPGRVLETPLGSVRLAAVGDIGVALAFAAFAGLAGIIGAAVVRSRRRRDRRAA